MAVSGGHIPAPLLQVSLDPNKLLALERRMGGDVMNGGHAREKGMPNGASSLQPIDASMQAGLVSRGSARRKRSTPEQRHPSTTTTAGVPTTAGGNLPGAPSSGLQLQPGASAPRLPMDRMWGGREDSNGGGGSKRARNSSPLEQAPQHFADGELLL